jgi:hypothetical protein
VGARFLGALPGEGVVAAGGVEVLGAPAPLAGTAEEGAAPEGLEAEGAVTEPQRGAGDGLTWGGDAVDGAAIAGVGPLGDDPVAGLGAAMAPMGPRARREIANSGRLVAAPETPMDSG